MAGLGTRIKNAWSVFSLDPARIPQDEIVVSHVQRAERLWRDSQSAIMAPIITRIANDVSEVLIAHVDTDEDGYYVGIRKGHLNTCLTRQANLDQTGRDLIREVVTTALSNGAAAVVPDRSRTFYYEDSSTITEIISMRVGPITQWNNYSVEVNLYDIDHGARRLITLQKDKIAIVYNPFFGIMNETNTLARRLVEKLALSDMADSNAVRPPIDLILKLPYAVRGSKRQDEARRRIDNLVGQLENNEYGVAYVDGSENVIQMNRSIPNILHEQVAYLYDRLYAQLGLSPAVFDGTAKQEEMISYFNTTIQPMLNAITTPLENAFISPTAYTQGQRIRPIRNIFKMATLSETATAADALSRNELATGHELRDLLGFKKSSDPKAGELRNKNINQPEEEPQPKEELIPKKPVEEEINGEKQKQ